ncbi:MAG: alpha/beta hydrolase [Spirochaetae bacterium HGW-Spirochaetae-5]|nr:MAG: alpha/beta hydrolase [Spirochaetae bacterium HGW-Spirochaetae-5]
MKISRYVMITFASVLSASILLLAGLLFIYSPGKAIPYLDEKGNHLEGSISEKVFIDIGGVRQGMFIKSKNSTNPVLLYLHGGLPEYFLTQNYPAGLEEYFTVVWWEQRGSGISYSDDIPAESMTLEQMISDTIEISDWLRRRFGKEKIYLMGHSGGTFIGIQAAARAPDLFYAYIGVAQISNQLKSEFLAYEYMLNKFREKGDSKMVRKFEAAPVSLTAGIPDSYLRLRDPAMHTLGIGTTHEMNSVITGIFLPSLTCREYTLNEKINMWHGKSRSGVSIMWADILAADMSVHTPEVKIPVYFIEGVYDYTCSYTEAKLYFEKLKAPVKGFYTFNHSAHSPHYEEPEVMLKIIREDILTGGNRLSDKNIQR